MVCIWYTKIPTTYLFPSFVSFWTKRESLSLVRPIRIFCLEVLEKLETDGSYQSLSVCIFLKMIAYFKLKFKLKYHSAG